jgi:NO-binding membrane sensor protein with MHYT domain
VAEIHQFEYGWLTPGFAYAMSVLGSLLGLVSTARARGTNNTRKRAALLILAAWSIGGTGIWVMHFIAMIGFTVPASPLRYDLWLTVLSFFISVTVVGVGLFIVGFGRPSAVKVVVGGLIMGVSVAFMHYTGMAAMHLHGAIGYDRNLVLASYLIAVIASIAALWFTIVVRGFVSTVVAASIMGVAVSGMHYTGMAAMRVHLNNDVGSLPGLQVDVFLAPIMLFVIVVVFILANTIMAIPSYKEQKEAAMLRAAMAGGGTNATERPGVSLAPPSNTNGRAPTNSSRAATLGARSPLPRSARNSARSG